jgi:hypothetical protein
MDTRVSTPEAFEFCFPQLDTLLLVENSAESVVIRATRDTFSEPRKLAFIRELASEGFIADEYRWLSADRLHACAGIRWLVDYRWLALSPQVFARSRRFVVRLLAGAALTWLAMMVFLFSRHFG